MAFRRQNATPILASMTLPLTLRAAGAADLEAVMAIERSPGFEHWVGRSSADEHRAMMADANYAYLVGEAGGAVVAFAILRGFADRRGDLYLKRVAVARPDEGVGGAFVAQVVDWGFARADAFRFSLDCFVYNARARRVYEKVGFVCEGVLREAYLGADGVRRDLTAMALTRAQWRARAARG